MQAWVVVMVVVLVIALALTVYGALHDRTLNRRRAEEMLGPPKRDIPNLPAEARSPAYVTEAQARRRPAPTPATSQPAGADADEDARAIGVGYASEDFVTDAATRSVTLLEPFVLVCDDVVETVRELLPALELVIKAEQPIVVVAPSIAPEVLGTLEVNAIQGKVAAVAVLADDAVRREIAGASGATPVDRTDRRSGWADPAAFGHLASWTSTRSASTLVPLTRAGAAG